MPDRDAAGGGGMSGGGAGRAAALERRYRRLLRCCPPSHRRVHREEMLGVLLATARPGQRTPGAAQTVNLVACGLAIRARRALSRLAGDPWQDALAVVSLIAPVLMLIIAALDFAVTVRQHWAEYHGLPPAAVMTGWLAVVLLGLTGRRRTAAAIASILLALALLNLLVDVTQLRGTVGWRVAVLVAAGLLLDLANTYPLGVDDLTAIVVLLLGSLLGAVLVWPVAIASWRGRVRRASRAG
jgi:hypothetical protein